MNAAHDSDRNLLADAYAGHSTAMDRLANQYRRYLKRIVECRLDDRLSTRLDASDLVQETLLEAFDRFKRTASVPDLPVRLWLRQIVIDRIRMAERSHLRTEKRSLLREIPMSTGSSLFLAKHYMAANPADRLSRQELVDAVRRAVAELSNQDQDILMMRTFDGLSYEEIEILTSISAAAARKRYGRALIRLQEQLERELSGSMG